MKVTEVGTLPRQTGTDCETMSMEVDPTTEHREETGIESCNGSRLKFCHRQMEKSEQLATLKKSHQVKSHQRKEKILYQLTQRPQYSFYQRQQKPLNKSLEPVKKLLNMTN